MAETIIKIAYIVFAFITVAAVVIAVKKMEKKNKVVEINEALLDWEDIKCPKCQTIMEQGYAFAGKGIIWTAKWNKLPGTFTTTFTSLENTLSMSLSPRVNMAWHCDRCKMVILDHSRMLKRKKR